MRFAYLATTLADRNSIGWGPFDEPSLLELAQEHDVTVLVDESTPAVDRLREDGIRIHVSDKRTTLLPHGVVVSADAVQASLLARWHEIQPYDLLVYSAERPFDLAQHEPALAHIPRATVLDAGPLLASRLAMESPQLAWRYGRYAWLSAGFAAGSDILISDAPPEAYGLRGSVLPPWRRVHAMPESRPPGGTSGLLVVVATTDDLAGLAGAVPRALKAVPVDTSTTIVVIHAALPGVDDRVRKVVADASPPRLREATILVPVRDEQGVGSAFVASADTVVCSKSSDLAIPAVRRRAAQVPAVVLDDGHVREAAPFTRDLPPPRDPARVVTVAARSGGLPGIVELLDRLEDEDRADMVVLHDPDYAEDAARLARAPRVGRADIAIMTRPRLPYGDADARRACRHLIAVHRRLWSSLRPLLRDAPTLAHVVVPGLDLSHTDAVRLLMLPGPDDECGRLRKSEDYWSSVWIANHGVLPRPRLGADAAVRLDRFARKRTEGGDGEHDSSGGVRGEPDAGDRARDAGASDAGPDLRTWVEDKRWAQRARLALPWRFGLLAEVMAPDGPDALPPAVRAWVKDHPWADRARLALPWRLGLLPRAMRGRWT